MLRNGRPETGGRFVLAALNSKPMSQRTHEPQDPSLREPDGARATDEPQPLPAGPATQVDTDPPVVGHSTSVFLVGPMGSGKSAVGRAVARLLGYGFVDSDAEVEHRTGVDIPFIFEKEGEAGFRLREREVIEELTRWKRTVVATGGGAILLEQNRQNLVERGLVVYLQASVAQQAERTRHGRHRPLLNEAEDPRQRLAELMAFRQPLYLGVARLVVETDGRRVQTVAEDIVAGLRRLGLPTQGPPTRSEL
jgi:shikimate kinase